MDNNDIFSKFYSFEDNEENNNECPSVVSMKNFLIKKVVGPNPFGLTWSLDNMKNFLKYRGYKILERTNEITGDLFEVAVKPSMNAIPNDSSNIVDLFNEEVQLVLLDWLKSLNK